MLPVPPHLKATVDLPSVESGDDFVTARLHCSCGSEHFRLRHPGQTHEYRGEQIPRTAEIEGRFYFVLDAQCVGCGEDRLLFDADLHGWNGVRCHDPEQANWPRPPLVVWRCARCAGDTHSAEITISGESFEDFRENSDEDATPEQWAECYGWFSMAIRCVGCGKETASWVEYETM